MCYVLFYGIVVKHIGYLSAIVKGYTNKFDLINQGLEEVSRTDIGKKIKEGVEEAAKTAKSSAETVSKSGEKFGKSGAFRAISQVQRGSLDPTSKLLK